MSESTTSPRSQRSQPRARLLALIAMLVAPDFAHAAEVAPPFKLIRADEDYSYLADTGRQVDLDDQLKYIQFSNTGHLTLGGELRERFDDLDAPKFGIGASRDRYLLQRVLLHADAHIDDHARVFIQLGNENALNKDRPYSVSDVDRIDLQNAFVDFVADPDVGLTLRLGRQELAFNATQRFVSVREGPNVRQSFDGARATWAGRTTRLDAFVTRPVSYRPGSFDDRSDPSQRFYGFRFSRELIPEQSLEVYAIELDRQQVHFGRLTGDEQRHSIGARSAGREDGFDHDVEAIYQGGSFAGREIRAWALGLTGGFTFAAPWLPRAGLEFDAGSGDRHPAGGRLETFNPMFPKGAYFNESALTSWANLVMLRTSLAMQPSASTTLSVSAAERWRQTGEDAVYLQPYIPIAATLANNERRVGEAYQLDAAWRTSRYFTITAEALRQTAGPAIRLAGGKPVTFWMFIGQFRF